MLIEIYKSAFNNIIPVEVIKFNLIKSSLRFKENQ